MHDNASQLNADHNDQNRQPTVSTKSKRVDKRHYLKFNGNQRMISDINLNPTTGKKDIVNVFIVYRLNAYDASSFWFRKGLFGQYDTGYDKMVSFLASKDIIILGTAKITLSLDPQLVA